MSELGINEQWLKQEHTFSGPITIKPILEEVWDKLDAHTKRIFENPKKRGFFKKTLISSKDYHKIMTTAAERYHDGESNGPTEQELEEYLEREPPSGGKSRKSRKTGKSRKSRKSRKVRKFRKSRKSRKSRKHRKSRKSRKHRMSRK